MTQSNGDRLKGGKVLKWTIVILIALPALFYLFEYVVPRFLPANF